MFSNTAEYALRALVQLAASPAGEATLGRELAARSDVPANYLSKILLTLKKAGLVQATRGLGGGYRLSKPARQVSLAEVVDIFDPLESGRRCLLDGRRPCSEQVPCSAHGKWDRVRATYLDFLHGTTLAEIAAPAALDLSPNTTNTQILQGD